MACRASVVVVYSDDGARSVLVLKGYRCASPRLPTHTPPALPSTNTHTNTHSPGYIDTWLTNLTCPCYFSYSFPLNSPFSEPLIVFTLLSKSSYLHSSASLSPPSLFSILLLLSFTSVHSSLACYLYVSIYSLLSPVSPP